MNELAHVISGCTQMPVHLATARVSRYHLPRRHRNVGQSHAEPVMRMRALVAQCDRLKRIRVFRHSRRRHEHVDAFDFVAYCGSGSNRDILPAHYSQLPELIRDGRLRIDVVMLQVSPPDEHGRYNSAAREYLLEAVKRVRLSRKCIPTLRERVDQLHLIGDARSARDIQPAIREGHIAGRSIK